MKLFEIVFSPTGGTQKVSDILCDTFDAEKIKVDLLKSETVSLSSEDIALIAVPSFGGRAPATAIERLAAIQGNRARAILVCVYGNRAFEDTLVELEDATKKAGFRPVAAVAAIAKHSIVSSIAHNRPDAEDEKQLHRFAKDIQKKLQENEDSSTLIPGNRPYKKRSEISMVPKPNRRCVSCGICIKECPVHAIDRNDPSKVDGSLCIGCMRCVSVCPHDARSINKVMAATAGLMLKKVASDRKSNELFI